MYCRKTLATYLCLMLKITYLLDSFIEFIAAVSKKTADHYVVFKEVRDIWLSLDNTEVKKANMAGMFRVNLAFYHNINTSKCVDYNIDFADIKQGHARRWPPQLSIQDDASKDVLNEGAKLQNEVSQGDRKDIQPKSSDSTFPDMMSLLSAALGVFERIGSCQFFLSSTVSLKYLLNALLLMTFCLIVFKHSSSECDT